MSARPGIVEEQKIELAESLRGWQRAGVISPEEHAALAATTETPWRLSKLPLRIGFFVLTWIGVSAASGLFFLALRSAGAIAIGLCAIGLAEFLIRTRRFFRTGVEEALWIVGIIMILAQLGFFGVDDEKILVFLAAVAVLLTGVRLLNPLFAFAGIATAILWIGIVTESSVATAAAVIAAGVVAALIDRSQPARPWVESLAGWLTALAPPVSWAILLIEHERYATAWAGVAAALWLVAGVAFRSRATLAGGWLSLFAFAFDLLRHAPLAVEAKLLIGGASLFVATAILEPWLRTPRRGFTSIPLGDDEKLGPALDLVGVAAIAPGALPEGRARGGEFGGAGASGEY